MLHWSVTSQTPCFFFFFSSCVWLQKLGKAHSVQNAVITSSSLINFMLLPSGIFVLFCICSLQRPFPILFMLHLALNFLIIHITCGYLI